MFKLTLAPDERCYFPAFAQRRVVVRDQEGTPCAYGWRRGEEHWLDIPDIATFRVGPGTNNVIGIARKGVDADLVLDAYYGTALPMAVHVLSAHEVLHASAVFDAKLGVVAFSAMSEVGKSTFAYGMQERGYSLWADDAVAFETQASGKITCPPLPYRLRLRSASAAYFTTRSQPQSNADRRDQYSSPASRAAPFAVLCILERAARRRAVPPVEIVRLPLAKALLAVLPHAFHFQPLSLERKSLMMRSYLDLAARVPVLQVRFQAGFDQLQRILEQIDFVVRDSVGKSTAPSRRAAGAA